ncbi:hypothetical protein BHM03_00062482, partial [Ensete ventricosum]
AVNMRKAQIAAAFTTKCCRSPSLSRAKDATKREPRPTHLPHNAQRNQNEIDQPPRIKNQETTMHRETNKEIEKKGSNLGAPIQLRQGTSVSNLPPASSLGLAGSASREPLKETPTGPPLPSSSFSTRTIDLRCDDRRTTRLAWDQWGEAFGLLPPQLSVASLSTPNS